MSDRRTVVVSSGWGEPHSELGFVARAIAGAATRLGAVSVLVPGRSLGTSPDGAFDVQGLGPPPFDLPGGLSGHCIAIVDNLTQDVASLLEKASVRDVLYVGADHQPQRAGWRHLRLAGPVGSGVLQLYVPVNRLAQRHRHNGFGFTGYELVLSRPGSSGDAPPAEAAWITAAFRDRDVIVVEEGIASAWKGRALRGRVLVDTRMDLWRLVAHANACIDLSPGRHFARECVESMRFGTPIVVPQGSGAAHTHARSAGGWTFADPYELLAAVAQLHDGGVRPAASTRAQQYADANHGSPQLLVESLETMIMSA